MRRSFWIVAAAALAALAIGVVPASSAGTLDQKQEVITGWIAWSDSREVAQTFTAGLTGALDQVDVHLARTGHPGLLVVAIRATSGGLPTGPDLVSETVLDVPTSGTWVSVPLDPTLAVSAGTTYAIVLYLSALLGGDVTWFGTNNTAYAGGDSYARLNTNSSWIASGSDQAFRTYVTTPTVAPSCDGQPATIYVNAQGVIVGGPNNGQPYQGKLNGTAGNDVMVGTSGPDEIAARAGNDLVCAGEGNDEIEGGPGNDRIFGEGGNDDMSGGRGNDEMTGGPGADKFRGGAGTDTATDFNAGEGDTKRSVEVS